MSANPVTIPLTATIQDAARLMLQRKVAGLPVVDDGRLVGIITESDIFRLVVSTWEREAVAPIDLQAALAHEARN
jgi:acetoin utilization protein AcuB